MTKAKALATTLAVLGLPIQTLNAFVFRFFWHFREEWPEESRMLNCCLKFTSREFRKFRAELAGRVTVGDLLRLFNDEERINREKGLPYRPSNHQMGKNFNQKLIDLGLTRLDWIHLPQSTMENVKLSMSEWLDQPIVLLGTLSGVAVRMLHERKSPTMTVGDLLSLDVPEEGYYLRDCDRSFRKTHQKLRELGFKREDGVFMRTYSKPTKDEVVREVISRTGLTHRQATNFVHTAAKVGTYDELWDWV
jgi:hypothetical protein